MPDLSLAALTSDQRPTGTWAASLLRALARDELAGRRPARLTEPQLATWTHRPTPSARACKTCPRKRSNRSRPISRCCPTRPGCRCSNLLREGEHHVGDLAQLAGTTSANVSRHLAQLMRHGLVAREGRGTSVYYSIADASVYRLCDLVCGSLARRLDQAADARALFAAAPGAAEPAGRRRAARGARRG